MIVTLMKKSSWMSTTGLRKMEMLDLVAIAQSVAGADCGKRSDCRRV